MAPLEVTTVAGSGERGHLDGLGVAVKFSFPGAGVTCDSVGNLVWLTTIPSARCTPMAQ